MATRGESQPRRMYRTSEGYRRGLRDQVGRPPLLTSEASRARPWSNVGSNSWHSMIRASSSR